VSRITRIVIGVPPRPDGSHKDALNMLALVLPPGATLLGGPAIRVSNAGTGVWGVIDPVHYPNIDVLPPGQTMESDGLRLAGCRINNRDERLQRFVEATFSWEGTGPDMAQTSVENFRPFGSTPGEQVSIAIAVPPGARQVPAVDTYRDGSASAPFLPRIPGNMTAAPGVQVDLADHYVPLGHSLGVSNGDIHAHRVVRLTAATG
jgi:hypothetical protein